MQGIRENTENTRAGAYYEREVRPDYDVIYTSVMCGYA